MDYEKHIKNIGAWAEVIDNLPFLVPPEHRDDALAYIAGWSHSHDPRDRDAILLLKSMLIRAFAQE